VAVLCVGHSHVIAVALAAHEAGVHLDILAFRNLGALQSIDGVSVLVEKPKFLSPAAIALLDRPVFSFVGKRDHTDIAFLRHSRPFDFVLPEDDEAPLDPAAEVVPVDAVRRLYWTFAKPALGGLRQIIRRASGPVYHFESPPPAARGWLTENEFRDDQIAPDALRLKAYRLYSAFVRDTVEQLGAQYVPYPAEAADADGFLRPELCRNATHGNALYGSLVLDQMKALS
jgi:hypothetical protein